MFWLIIPTLLMCFDYFYLNQIKKISLYLFGYKKPEATLKIIYDGEEIANYRINDFLNKKCYITYDFILYSIPVENEKYDNYVLRYENLDDILEVEYTSLKSIELTDLYIIVNETEKYPIDLGRNQYFINGNVLFDRPFLRWHLNVHCNVQLESDDVYRVIFRDNENKLIALPDYCYILIKNNNYLVVNLINEINK